MKTREIKTSSYPAKTDPNPPHEERHIGQTIKENRLRVGLTQEDLAKATMKSQYGYVSVRTIKRLESGQTKPRYDTLLSINETLGSKIFKI